ncbi:MAG: NUDIX hydrolase [Desulfonatronovibrionaceae bacterium]
MHMTEIKQVSPRPAVGAVVRHEGRLLLVKRAKPPARGQWAIPGGKIRGGETIQEAAQREVLEETGIVIEAGRPVLVFDLIERDESGNLLYHYVIVDVEARYVSGRLKPGSDALDAAWALESELKDYNVNEMTMRLVRQGQGQ